MDNMYEWFKDLYEEVENDIKDQTKEGYDASDLIILQDLLLVDFSKIEDHYYLSDINLDDSVNLRWAIKDMIRKISWSLYHGNYKEMSWLYEFRRSYEDSL